MNINGKAFRTIWVNPEDPQIIQIIDQRWLPHKLVIEDLKTLEDVTIAIRDMHLRGAPLIGSAAAFGMYIAALEAPEKNPHEYLNNACRELKNTRPTAVNLAYAVDKSWNAIQPINSKTEIEKRALKIALEITEESVQHCQKIGSFGLQLIEEISIKKGGKPVNILTHCNAGWFACVDFGTATAPIYAAHDKGIDVHVWVDETRPRNQGARITAFELLNHGVPHTVIPDNVGGHLMQHEMVDLVIVGSDRTTVTGDVANKIGTYLKALAAFDNQVPFYVALPSSTIDWNLKDGLKEIPIEQRDSEEVKYIQGLDNKEIRQVLLTPKESPATNYAFDVTPARFVTGLITEKGICQASKQGILNLFSSKNDQS
ncbi:MAG: S-methyl-5-thioribose-1-phosphate isomerase [Bacteroidetes bacterium]|jgi:methylthioribose-1-phosphate isomerase|nr:S-methyl-5-thioribose-1-phosphate isomerase [Bacteroidota bacterium]MDF1868652.1 S-methyl-5-thioribose-1-phosphate isomerase [Saprospiraceae bacterium]